MKPHHFGIFKEPMKTEFGAVCLPEFLTPYFEKIIPESVQEKTFSRFGDEIDFSCDLILKDFSLIEDLKCDDCFLFFVFSNRHILDKNNFYWDDLVNEGNLKFIGWNIANYESGDYAFTDGCFPLTGQQIAPEKYAITVEDLNAINKFGLIKNEDFLNLYVKKNNSLKYIYGDSGDAAVNLNWNSYAIFCDHYTLKKLNL